MKQNNIFSLPMLCTITALIAILLNFQEPFWSVITVALLYTEQIKHPIQKALHRIIGTILGALIGVLICYFSINTPLLRLLLIFIMIFIGSYYSHNSRHSYAWILATGTAFVVVLASWIGSGEIVKIALWRLSEIGLGVIISTLYYLAFSSSFKLQTEKDFKTHPYIIERSIKTGIACLLVTIIWIYSHWYGGIVGVVSALIISLKQEEAQLLATSIERFMGCLIGTAVGLICIIFFPHSIAVLLILIFSVTSLYAYLHDHFQDNAYAKLQAIIAFFIVILPANNIISMSIFPALERVSGILLGVSVTLIVHYLIWPKSHSRVIRGE